MSYVPTAPLNAGFCKYNQGKTLHRNLGWVWEYNYNPVAPCELHG